MGRGRKVRGESNRFEGDLKVELNSEIVREIKAASERGDSFYVELARFLYTCLLSRDEAQGAVIANVNSLQTGSDSHAVIVDRMRALPEEKKDFIKGKNFKIFFQEGNNLKKSKKKQVLSQLKRILGLVFWELDGDNYSSVK